MVEKLALDLKMHFNFTYCQYSKKWFEFALWNSQKKESGNKYDKEYLKPNEFENRDGEKNIHLMW